MNILFLLTDQWPHDSFGRYRGEISTPNMDRLASQGTVFTNAFTSCPLCSPARGTLFTGRWTFQSGMMDNQNIGHSTQKSLALSEDTWLDSAMRNGFETEYFGKWHLGPEDQVLNRLDKPVWEPEPKSFTFEDIRKRYKEIEKTTLIEGNAPFWGILPGSKEDTLCFKTAAKGVKFLEEYAEGNREKAFCLTVSTASPHFPHYLPKEYADKADPSKITLPSNLKDDYHNKPPFHNIPWWPSMDTSGFSEEDWKTIIAYTHQHISMTDEALGTVLDTLERFNLTEDTMIVFTADHGDMPGAHNRFDKGAYFYEEVWRIPMLVKYPGKKAARQKAWVNLIDLAETFYQIIEPGDAKVNRRYGLDMYPLLGTKTQDERPNRAIGVYDYYNGLSMAVRAIRDERYKYIWNPQSIDELYDLKTDPDELNNLIDSKDQRETIQGLKNELIEWMQQNGDPMLKQYSTLPPWGTIVSTGEMGP